ncbi:pyridoxamine 5'-phosphate oxidase [Kineococcus xinjiangensis]|uniref:Pyridoxamine 5'-phosphate oxidase n=1 Tax=Kineococcus xinjiangensis TaxID=512762 RepID=A0A2S6IVG4_9ACTN|nr:pyridoxamine 5'-phosphate oxidase [Kineococcus xinjiangensis]
MFDRSLPTFDTSDAPEEPVALCLDWLRHAIGADVPEPHAVTLSTVDAHGAPDARVLILKDVDVTGWYFASSADSAKGVQLAQQPKAALSSYWPLLGRQIRVRGVVSDAGSEAAGADFLARSLDARAEALLGRQSQVRPDGEDAAAQLAAARRRLEAAPDSVASSWRLYVLQPREVEFWQAAVTRRHTRLRYRSEGGAWVRQELWA